MNVIRDLGDAWTRSKAGRRYEALAPRERLLVRLCVGLLGLLVFYAGVDALLEFRSEAVGRYLNEQRDLQWMKRNRHLVASGDAGAGSGELLSTVVNSTAAQFGFRPRRTQTESDGVSARIEGEDFEKVLRWAHALESRHAVEISRADIDLKEPGWVDARVSLR